MNTQELIGIAKELVADNKGLNVRFKSRLPWAPAFSFARGIQHPALEIWRGEEVSAKAAQQALLHLARYNRAARRGESITLPRWKELKRAVMETKTTSSNLGAVASVRGSAVDDQAQQVFSADGLAFHSQSAALVVVEARAFSPVVL